MKNKLIYVLSAVILIATSCSKSFLDRPSLNGPTLDNYYTNQQQVEGATALLYNQVWYNWLDKAFHCIGEVYGGNMITSAGDPNYGNNTYVYFTVQGTDGQDLNAWQAFYKVAGNATVLMNTFQQIRNNQNASFIDPGIAEAQFIRGVAYFYIARTYGDAPIVTDPVALAGSGNLNVPRYFQKDVLRFALNDLVAAEAGLPEDPYQKGRVTKYSAAGMAAKIYLYMGNYDSAAIKANEVIQSGKYSLYPDYKAMFTTAKANNNSESLFALQWIAGGYSYANDIQAYAGPASLLKPDFNTGYSSVIPSLDLLNAYDPGDKRKEWSVMQQGYTNPSWKNVNFPNGFTYDTSVGGVADDATHITTGTRSNSLKYINGPADNGGDPTSAFGDALNVYILRYADVLLIYAEGILGTNASTSDAGALNAFNLVHTRAGLPPVSSITKDMIMHERRVEFAFEGDYWYDVQRQGFEKAQQIINSQERGTLNGDGTINHVHATFTSESQLYLPIPSDEVVADPELAKPAVPYY
ncbi:MAG: RagB/SusD family nutrient uptake outer membrane protein [Parafilimonas sp.]|nr:RagB/SusD family nutrient uptake outer membrane protein [Parafilimonas sp.]